MISIAGGEGHINHNNDENKADNGNRGNRGTHSNNCIHQKCRNNRAPLVEQLPGHKFDGTRFGGRMCVIALQRLGSAFRSNSLISEAALMRGNILGVGGKDRGSRIAIGLLTANILAGGLMVMTSTYDVSTRGVMRSLNNRIELAGRD